MDKCSQELVNFKQIIIIQDSNKLSERNNEDLSPQSKKSRQSFKNEFSMQSMSTFQRKETKKEKDLKLNGGKSVPQPISFENKRYDDIQSKEEKEIEERKIDYLRKKIEQEKLNKAKMILELNQKKSMRGGKMDQNKDIFEGVSKVKIHALPKLIQEKTTAQVNNKTEVVQNPISQYLKQKQEIKQVSSNIKDVYQVEDANIFKNNEDEFQEKNDALFGIRNSLSSKQYIEPKTGVTYIEPEKTTKEIDLDKIPPNQKFIKKGPDYNPLKNANKMSVEAYQTLRGFGKFGSERVGNSQQRIYQKKQKGDEEVFVIPSDLSLAKPLPQARYQGTVNIGQRNFFTSQHRLRNQRKQDYSQMIRTSQEDTSVLYSDSQRQKKLLSNNNVKSSYEVFVQQSRPVTTYPLNQYDTHNKSQLQQSFEKGAYQTNSRIFTQSTNQFPVYPSILNKSHQYILEHQSSHSQIRDQVVDYQSPSKKTQGMRETVHQKFNNEILNNSQETGIFKQFGGQQKIGGGIMRKTLRQLKPQSTNASIQQIRNR